MWRSDRTHNACRATKAASGCDAHRIADGEPVLRQERWIGALSFGGGVRDVSSGGAKPRRGVRRADRRGSAGVSHGTHREGLERVLEAWVERVLFPTQDGVECAARNSRDRSERAALA